MNLWTTLLIAVGLGMDAFAVSIAAGLIVKRITYRHVFRAGFHFGLFQFAMPVLGWLAGGTFADALAAFDHWVAFALLSAVGAKMLHEGLSGDQSSLRGDPTRGWMLVTLSVATSIDALAVGLSLAVLQTSIWMPAAVIGVVASVMSTIGITFGSRLGHRWERRAEVGGGILLIAIGLRILVGHLAEAGPVGVNAL